MDSIVAKKQKNKNIFRETDRNRNFLPKYNNDTKYHVYQLGRAYQSEDLYISDADFKDNDMDSLQKVDENIFEDIEEKDEGSFSLWELPIFSQESILIPKSISSRFVFILGMFVFVFSSFLFVGTAFAVKNKVDNAGKRAISSIKIAIENLRTNDFSTSGENFDKAYEEFTIASTEMNRIGGFAIFIAKFVPGASKISSGDHIIEAGKYLTHTAKEFHTVIPAIVDNNDSLMTQDGKHISLLALYRVLADKMNIAYKDVSKAKDHINKVHLDDVPKEYQDTFVQMKETLPLIENSLKQGVESREVVEDLLGANGPRTYLFLFQNNHEMRATGGFIGSYGIVKINNGNIEKMIVDDIFNPDGQLIDKIVPPLPIQKISADWSLHDSNWFADFPLSAKKAIDFYERTGGPTVDGVVAITPTMMKKFLLITGPIKLSNYDTVLTSKNFMEIMQSKVEDKKNYNIEGDEKSKTKKLIDEKEKEQPKKILSDLMPVMIDKLLEKKSPQHFAKLLGAVASGMKEKHIIIYMRNKKAQKIIESNGWGGEILQTDKDYLSVINTNINGFKTDGVVDEKITHIANIDKDGYIVDTVQIKRKHNGGKTGFPWWDAVNADYMRVYVPQGAELLSVEGQTREINKERLDYDALGYERDSDIEREENNMRIDKETGTRIYNEYNKTVFANWVYVSPQESVTITYKYRLPFRVNFNEDNKGKFGSYAILFQKQSGSEKSSIKSNIVLNDNFKQVWTSNNDESLQMNDNLKTDRFQGIVFRVEE